MILDNLKYVKRKHNSWIYRPWFNKVQRQLIPTDKSGFLKPAIKLGSIADPETVLIERYKEAVAQVKAQLDPDSGTKQTINWLFKKYVKSPRFKELTPDIQKDYEDKLNVLRRFVVTLEDDIKVTIGELRLADLDAPTMGQLKELVVQDYWGRGLKGNTTVNHLFGRLKTMFNYGLTTIPNIQFDSNPCKDIRKLKEPKNERYVTDFEYWRQHELACIRGTDYLPIIFELAYLLAGRSIEVYNLTLDDLHPDDVGIIVDRRKGSKTNIVLYSPRLRRAVDCALALRKQRRPEVQENNNYLVLGRDGFINREALKSAMSRLADEARKHGIHDTWWSMHDLKSKGISDAKNRNIGGHRTQEMKIKYTTILEAFHPPNGQANGVEYYIADREY